MDRHDQYESPLAGRNASAAMLELWSARRKFTTWRKLWLALAEAEQELGLAITDEQLQQMREHLDDIDFDAAAAYEKRLRHDVMAHVHAFGDVAPAARPIIHLGATSQYVNCNAELLLIRESLELIAGKLATTIDRWSDEVLAYYRTGRASSGPVEAVNGEIEAVDRAARGFRSFHHYRTRMLLKTAVSWHTPPTPRTRGHAGQSDPATPAFIA